MAEVLLFPSRLPSSLSPDVSRNTNHGSGDLLSPSNGVEPVKEEEEPSRGGCVIQERKKETRRRGWKRKEAEKQQHELSVSALLLAVLRKSPLGCKMERTATEEFGSMEIGWPTDVRHVVHVTFDRFHGFIGLPVEFEPEIHSRVPSASTTVFGVSAEYMQCSYDSRGNSVPTILLLMQRRLYEQGGLQAEGIFRINAENSQEEFVRNQLNDGIVPEGTDVHCLAVLIKAWFRELPAGLLDSLSFEQVMQCQTEEDCRRLVMLLPPTEAGLLDWAINLMADVVQEEHLNKMNAHNVATVFAPNMTKMADPLTALMHAVQVMNFLRILIEMTLKVRQEPALHDHSPSDENCCPQLQLETTHSKQAAKQVHIQEPPMEFLARVLEKRPLQDEKSGSPKASDDAAALPQGSSTVQESETAEGSHAALMDSLRKKMYQESLIGIPDRVLKERPVQDEKSGDTRAFNDAAALPMGSSSVKESGTSKGSRSALMESLRKKMYRLNGQSLRKGRKARKPKLLFATRLFLLTEKSKRSSSILSSINSKVEGVEAI